MEFVQVEFQLSLSSVRYYGDLGLSDAYTDGVHQLAEESYDLIPVGFVAGFVLYRPGAVHHYSQVHLTNCISSSLVFVYKDNAISPYLIGAIKTQINHDLAAALKR